MQTNKTLLPPMPAMTEEEVARAKRESLRRNRKTWRRSYVELAILLIVIIGGFFGYRYFTRLPFNSAQWKSSDIYVRERMCDDLINSDRLAGLNHFQVVTLLGKPDQYGVRDWDMGYGVGLDVIDPVMLVLKFDKQKRVVEYDVRSFN